MTLEEVLARLTAQEREIVDTALNRERHEGYEDGYSDAFETYATTSTADNQ